MIPKRDQDNPGKEEGAQDSHKSSRPDIKKKGGGEGMGLATTKVGGGGEGKSLAREKVQKLNCKSTVLSCSHFSRWG